MERNYDAKSALQSSNLVLRELLFQCIAIKRLDGESSFKLSIVP